MRPNSLLSHLTVKFQTHPENLASEALAYILERPFASAGLRAFMERCGAKLPISMSFHAQQMHDDRSIPDIVGVDERGQSVLIIEAKFWAGLTDNQPVTYIGQLPAGTEGALLFVVPSRRLVLLWDEITERCRKAGINLESERKISTEVSTCRLQVGNTLVLSSWRALLDDISASLSADDPIVPDIGQLRGLTERMDDDAFLPLRSEDLTSDTPNRLLQFCRLVDDLSAMIINERIAEPFGNTRATAGTYYRPIRLGVFGGYIQFNAEYWRSRRQTPLWLTVREVKDGRWVNSNVAVTLALSSLMTGPRVRAFEDGPEILVPLEMPLGVERHLVVDQLLRQVRVIADLLRRAE